MARLIDADALSARLAAMQECATMRDHLYLMGVLSVIDNAPTIDAVPVVRCKDCVCSSMCNGQLICSRIADVTDRYYRGKAEIVMPDDYCSHGIQQKARAILDTQSNGE